MRNVKQLLASKGTEVWTVTADSSVYDALKTMAEKNIGALVVLDGDRLSGIFSERDYARKVVLQGKFSKDTPVRDIMTEDVFSVSPDRTITECMAVMTAGRFRHLPVMEDDRLVGLISIGDVVKVLLSEKDFMIEQLENFIAGGRG
jgi:CBS domain-containing protein